MFFSCELFWWGCSLVTDSLCIIPKTCGAAPLALSSLLIMRILLCAYRTTATIQWHSFMRISEGKYMTEQTPLLCNRCITCPTLPLRCGEHIFDKRICRYSQL